MIYQRPELRPLNARSAKGDSQGCAAGSGAIAGGDCSFGDGYTGLGACESGGGDGTWCYTGTAALGEFVPSCYEGPVPTTACYVGNSADEV
ncbi:hypothetical protein JXA88_10815 [Candidatus Fermentibacteria bacterium]|nr:hypothetical protein [Candidatus Fermentibacteria bacterium]